MENSVDPDCMKPAGSTLFSDKDIFMISRTKIKQVLMDFMPLLIFSRGLEIP